jgi:perosamine synthetase
MSTTPHPTPPRAFVRGPRRHFSLLGGTTTSADVALALRALASPATLQSGAALDAYEVAFADAVGVRHAISFSSGRVGLYFILQGLGIGPGDEVLVPLPTHVVVPNAVRYVGATPVYVDCRRRDVNVDLAAAEARITPRTRALLLQHTFGVPVDLDGARALAERHGLALVGDCVHALGARYRGRSVGAYGHAAFFSTEETKTISSTMGGVAVTNDDALAARLRASQSACRAPDASLVAAYLVKFVLYWLLTEPHVHGGARALYEALGRRHPLPIPVTPQEFRGERPEGFETRLSNAQAAIAHSQLRRLDENVAHRRRIAERYERALSAAGHPTIAVPAEAEPSFVRYPVWVASREATTQALRRHTVVGHWFTSVMEEASDPRLLDYELGSCPHAEAAATYLVNLPTHGRVRPDDADALATALLDAEPEGGAAARLIAD